MGTAVTLAATARSGYHFLRWQTSPAVTIIESPSGGYTFLMHAQAVTALAASLTGLLLWARKKRRR